GFYRRLGTARLLRPGEKLQDCPCQSAKRFERRCYFGRGQPLLANARRFRHGKKPQDQSRRSLGARFGQIVQLPRSLTTLMFFQSDSSRLLANVVQRVNELLGASAS